jgi:hypothetical protein
VLGVLVALLGLAVSPAGLRNVDLDVEYELRVTRESGRVSSCSVSESGFEIAIAGGMCDMWNICVCAGG